MVMLLPIFIIPQITRCARLTVSSTETWPKNASGERYSPLFWVSFLKKCLSVVSVTPRGARGRQPATPSYLHEGHGHHGDLALALCDVYGGPQSHNEVSQRQQAHQVHEHVENMRRASVRHPARFWHKNLLAKKKSPNVGRRGTHHFMERYFLQTGWLRSTRRLYVTIACVE